MLSYLLSLSLMSLIVLLMSSINVITARKRSLGQGNIFTPVCHSVQRGSCVVAGGDAWLQGGVRGCGGMCGGGVHGHRGCMVAGGHAWLWGMCVVVGVVAGACMVVGRHAWLQGCVCGCGGCVWLWGGHA